MFHVLFNPIPFYDAPPSRRELAQIETRRILTQMSEEDPLNPEYKTLTERAAEMSKLEKQLAETANPAADKAIAATGSVLKLVLMALFITDAERYGPVSRNVLSLFTR